MSRSGGAGDSPHTSTWAVGLATLGGLAVTGLVYNYFITKSELSDAKSDREQRDRDRRSTSSRSSRTSTSTSTSTESDRRRSHRRSSRRTRHDTDADTETTSTSTSTATQTESSPTATSSSSPRRTSTSTSTSTSSPSTSSTSSSRRKSRHHPSPPFEQPSQPQSPYSLVPMIAPGTTTSSSSSSSSSAALYQIPHMSSSSTAVLISSPTHSHLRQPLQSSITITNTRAAAAATTAAPTLPPAPTPAFSNLLTSSSSSSSSSPSASVLPLGDLFRDDELCETILGAIAVLDRDRDISHFAQKSLLRMLQRFDPTQYSVRTRLHAAQWLVIHHNIRIYTAKDEQQYNQMLKTQQQDMIQTWNILQSCTGQATDVESRDVDLLKLDVGQRFHDPAKLFPVFDRVLARGNTLTENELIVLFTVAPLLGKWRLTCELGDTIIAIKGSLQEFHDASVARPDIPDFEMIHHLARQQQIHGDAPISSLEWCQYQIRSHRIFLRSIDCDDPVAVASIKQDFTSPKDQQTRWRRMRVSSQSRMIRFGALAHISSASERPIMLVGPADHYSINVSGTCDLERLVDIPSPTSLPSSSSSASFSCSSSSSSSDASTSTSSSSSTSTSTSTSISPSTSSSPSTSTSTSSTTPTTTPSSRPRSPFRSLIRQTETYHLRLQSGGTNPGDPQHWVGTYHLKQEQKPTTSPTSSPTSHAIQQQIPPFPTLHILFDVELVLHSIAQP